MPRTSARPSQPSTLVGAFVRANETYWSGCARVWNDLATDLASNSGEGGQVKLARFIGKWAGVTGLAYEKFIQAFAKPEKKAQNVRPLTPPGRRKRAP